jgi:DNA mismatch endonuclease, patch repair protein
VRETPEQRSRTMRAVRSRDTRPEMVVRRFLHRAGLRYSLHDRGLPGLPDLVFRSRRAVLFVHGCFWHQHEGCAAAARPRSRVGYWDQKLDGNVERDKRHHLDLTAAGWTVLTIWECEAGEPSNLQALVASLRSLKITARGRRCSSTTVSRSRRGMKPRQRSEATHS